MNSGGQTNLPLVSIIVTSHNYESYLARAIGSALGQTYPNIEVIVIDDGSEDGSPEIIRSFGDRIQPVFKQQSGQCSCVNLGLKISSGEFIIFLDADDILLPDAVALHAAELSVAGTTKSCGYMSVISEDGAELGRRIPNRLPKSGNYRDVTLKYGLDVFQTSFTSAHAWSREFLEKVMPLPENGIIGPDGYLTAIDRLFGRIAFIKKPVVQYRRHARNKGPVRFRFDMDYMKNRLERKKHRQDFAEHWIKQLGYTSDSKRFRTVRDWRLALMQHVLWLNGEINRTLPFAAFVSTPFHNKRRNPLRSIRISLSLLAVRLLPRTYALSLSERLLQKLIQTNNSTVPAGA